MDFTPCEPAAETSHQWAGRQRRRHERFPFHQHAWALDVTSPEASHSIMTQDISVLGLGFVSIQAFERDAWLIVTIAFDKNKTRKILCRARHCRKMKDGFFLVGAEFVAAVAENPLQPDVPDEWIQWMRETNLVRSHMNGEGVLEPELIPGIFAEPALG